jgi:hypothetical protein
MCVVEYLLFTLWFCDVLILWKMVLGSLVRRKITGTVWVAGVYQIILPYNSKYL